MEQCDLDTEESSVLEHKEYAENIGASRDTVKIRKKSTVYGVEFVILGMEGQEHIHYAMPLSLIHIWSSPMKSTPVPLLFPLKWTTAMVLSPRNGSYFSKMKPTTTRPKSNPSAVRQPEMCIRDSI